MGVRSIPFGIAIVALGFVLKSPGTHAGPSDIGLLAERTTLSVFGTIHPALIRLPSPTAQAPLSGIRLASLDPEITAGALMEDDDLVAALGEPRRGASFDERFAAFDPTDSFETRFGGPRPAAAAGLRLASAGSVPVTLGRPAQTATARPMGRLQEATAPSGTAPTGAEEPRRRVRPGQQPKLAALSPNALPSLTEDGKTAIYDITAKTVYMPNGKRLEAHSGLGPKMDDPRHVNVRMHGATPPNVYRLTMRESLFHGVRALRMTPVDQSKMYGRAGILAHSYMLGPSGQSNGCVSFKDYQAFLDAYLRGEVNKIVVVERLDSAPGATQVASSNWLSDTLGKLFKSDGSTDQYAEAGAN
ncbi:DUF2778 domain-containing protein [Rhodoplanes azumiensis]|uniref:Tlde1 domain-containing protein n=1 Tax=Rhodoplanes azumiensis TaxID=1897628 RepID=A0ABW5AHZ7_9BRAD